MLVKEEMHWSLATLARFDTWCGDTCHTLLRYVLRSLLVMVLVGTFGVIFMRAIDPKKRVGVKSRYGLPFASFPFGQKEVGVGGGTRKDGGMAVTTGQQMRELNGPDVRDSCAVM